MKFRSREIGCYNYRIAQKFDMHLSSTVAEVRAKFQSDWESLKLNLAASRLHEVLWEDDVRLVNWGPALKLLFPMQFLLSRSLLHMPLVFSVRLRFMSLRLYSRFCYSLFPSRRFFVHKCHVVFQATFIFSMCWNLPDSHDFGKYQDCGNNCTSSYYHHHIGNMTYYPLFKVRSWNNGIHYMFRYIMTRISSTHIRHPIVPSLDGSTWWRHQMENFSTLLALCAGNSPVNGEFPTQRPVTRSFDVFFDLRLNKRLSK